MARPEKHDADYFPFFAKRGKTLNILQAKFGLEGIGFFTNLFRFLTLTPDHHYQINSPVDQMNLFSEIGILDDAKGIEMLNLLALTGKIDADLWTNFKMIVSESLLESLTDAYSRRTNSIITIEEIRDLCTTETQQNDSESQKTEFKDTEIQQNNDKGSSNTQSKVKESKVKKSKVNNTEKKHFQIPTLPEIAAYCSERKNTVIPEQFLAHYDSNGWLVGKNKMKDWKAAIRYWEGNEKKYGNNSFPKQSPPPHRDISGGTAIKPKFTLGDYHATDSDLEGL